MLSLGAERWSSTPRVSCDSLLSFGCSSGCQSEKAQPPLLNMLLSQTRGRLPLAFKAVRNTSLPS